MAALAPSALAGTWHLVAWEIRQPDGGVSLPFGPEATGVICYTTDGHMSAAIARGGRQPYASGNPRAASEAERAAAADGYFHYAGPFEMGEDGGAPVVIHRVTHSLNPNFVGSEQRRFITFEGDRLVLSAREPLGEGRARDHRLIWRR